MRRNRRQFEAFSYQRGPLLDPFSWRRHDAGGSVSRSSLRPPRPGSCSRTPLPCTSRRLFGSSSRSPGLFQSGGRGLTIGSPPWLDCFGTAVRPPSRAARLGIRCVISGCCFGRCGSLVLRRWTFSEWWWSRSRSSPSRRIGETRLTGWTPAARTTLELGDASTWPRTTQPKLVFQPHGSFSLPLRVSVGTMRAERSSPMRRSILPPDAVSGRSRRWAHWCCTDGQSIFGTGLQTTSSEMTGKV